MAKFLVSYTVQFQGSMIIEIDNDELINDAGEINDDPDDLWGLIDDALGYINADELVANRESDLSVELDSFDETE